MSFGLANKGGLSRHTGQRKALIRILLNNILREGYIFTTTSRAKALKQLVDKLFTKVKKQDLANDRRIVSYLGNSSALVNLKNWANMPTVKQKTSGYTSVQKINYRKGDGSLRVCVRIIV